MDLKTISFMLVIIIGLLIGALLAKGKLPTYPSQDIKPLLDFETRCLESNGYPLTARSDKGYHKSVCIRASLLTMPPE